MDSLSRDDNIMHLRNAIYDLSTELNANASDGISFNVFNQINDVSDALKAVWHTLFDEYFVEIELRVADWDQWKIEQKKAKKLHWRIKDVKLGEYLDSRGFRVYQRIK